jgi:hypothetical protein
VCSRVPALCLASLSFWLCACKAPEPPGDLVGAYHITGALTDNSCGSAALPAASTLSFDVQIRESEGSAYWVQNAPPARSGELDADGSFTFELQSTYQVGGAMPMDPVEALIEMDPSKLANPQVYDQLDAPPTLPCQLTVAEHVRGRLNRTQSADGGGAAGADDAGTGAADDLQADNDIDLHAASGDCSALLATQGGPFQALPCTAHYDLTGTLTN